MKFRDRWVPTTEEGRIPIRRRSTQKVPLRVRSLVTLHRHREKVLIRLKNQGAVGISLQEEENIERMSCKENLGRLSLLRSEATMRREKMLKRGCWECESSSASTTTRLRWKPALLSISCKDKLTFGGNCGQE